ncbi:flagellar export protein FliJ [Thioalkalivibrio sp. ALE11]|uniref:flagellar export protein FliJ n=1 Tax=Thioalkalivibrio sp. ALE11 TaxID=1265494 RepID=UPI000371A2C7|nr:flagellar export protein FliJ [Thioalkalivibrio sp. ALE11]
MNPQRIERLLRIRQIGETEATRELGERIAQLNAAEAQREQLETFQQEYLAASMPQDPNTLKWLAGMRQKLREALEQQALRIQAAESQVETAREQWLEHHRDCMSLEKLLERTRAEEQRHQARRQQVEQDMWATRQAFAREPESGERTVNWQES